MIIQLNFSIIILWHTTWKSIIWFLFSKMVILKMMTSFCTYYCYLKDFGKFNMKIHKIWNVSLKFMVLTITLVFLKLNLVMVKLTRLFNSCMLKISLVSLRSGSCLTTEFQFQISLITTLVFLALNLFMVKLNRLFISFILQITLIS